MKAEWKPIDTAPRTGEVIEITALEQDGVPFEIWPAQWIANMTNPLFAPGIIGMWVLPDMEATWREGEGGPTHWRPLQRGVCASVPTSPLPSPPETHHAE